MSRVHLDYYAQTPFLPDVREAVEAALSEAGNPSSIHEAGRRAKELLERARRQVAELLNASPDEMHFTSCGTESNNWALRGLFAGNRRRGNHIVISAIEHPSVSLVARRLGLEGADITTLPVDREGFVSPDDLKAALKAETVLVSIMLANGEVGTIEPIRELAAIVGMGVATELATRDLPQRVGRLGRLRDRLREGLATRLGPVRFNGSWSLRLPHNLHLCVGGVMSESLVLGLDQAGIAAGLGSACNSKAMRPSHVLKAMGLTDEEAKGALVLTVGVPTTETEVDRAVEIIPPVAERLQRVTRLTARAS
jgi:cysteine sulfinate desulfinase/cysteine desulfurase-like protein